ncbi:MAG: ankyrin repeat domain-containing protein [Candidatus Cloacimonadota bacterium]|nr:ankyrin repeat domain-containing protein [Candidatus Cloacimonadota bacterium]
MSIKEIFPEIYATYPDLHKAVTDDKISEVIRLVLSGVDPNELDDFDQTPLMLAEQFIMAKFLIEHGADVNALDKHGRSALTHASDPLIVKLLIEEKADLDVVDLDGFSILDYTFDYICTGAYKLFLLIHAGAKNNSRFQEVIQDTYEEILKATDFRNEFKISWMEQNKKYNNIFRKQLIEHKRLLNLRKSLNLK